MAIGERIRFIRNLRGMTQKYLGTAVGFPEKTADIRMAQYESGTRTPKEDLIQKLAEILDVSPQALTVPDIESYIGVMHTLFALEDLYGLQIGKLDGEVCIRLDRNSPTMNTCFEMLLAWNEEHEKLKNEEITKEEYDAWRYTYPEIEAKRRKERFDEKRMQRRADE